MKKSVKKVIRVSHSINLDWNEYDTSVGTCQLENWGIIFLDDYDLPIDDEYYQEYLYDQTYFPESQREVEFREIGRGLK